MKTIFEEMGGTYRQVGDYFRECPNTQLKEIKKRKWDMGVRMSRAVLVFGGAKAVVCPDKNR